MPNQTSDCGHYKLGDDLPTSITIGAVPDDQALKSAHSLFVKNDRGDFKEEAEAVIPKPRKIRRSGSWDSAISYETMNSTLSSAMHSSEDGSSSFLRNDARRSTMDMLKDNRSRSDHATSDFTINKLDIKSLGVVGRERESSILNKCFRRLSGCDDESVCQASNRSFNMGSENELVFISGYSGIGKSTLSRSLKTDVVASNGVFAEGKYEFTSIEPYSGIAQAFGGLCNSFRDSSVDMVADISQTIAETMREEFKMLKGLIPELGVFFDSDDEEEDSELLGGKSEHGRVHSTGNEHERWKYAFRMLTRILGTHFSSIIIVLDDLQWADASSLDIMDYLISDVQNPHPLMIIGCYRSNEVKNNSILFDRIQSLQTKSEKFGFHITKINLESIDIDSVNKMIMTMLSIDDESKTRDLAEVCFKRTSGNPFFLIEFMKMLQAEGLLEFNLGILKWVWEVSRIENATMSAANVVDLLQSQMRKLPADVQFLLQYAACLGSSFSLQMLDFIWKNHAMDIFDGVDSDVVFLLEIVLREKLIEVCGPDEYRWVHDKVQEAALSLSALVTPMFQFGLGICLYEGLNEIQLEKQLFDVVDLINKGHNRERSDLSELNLRAAKKARKMAAFQSAARYVANGIRHLAVEDSWIQHRELTLKLYLLGAEMNMAIGQIDVVQEYVDSVLDREDHTPMETVRLKMIKLEILNTVELRHDEATKYGVQVLKDIGYNVLWRRGLLGAQSLTSIMKTVRRLEKLPMHSFKTLEMMEDPTNLAVANVLSMLHVASHNGNDIFFNFLCVCKIIETTLDHGIHAYSAAGFASLGAIVMFLKNDSANASRFCDMAFLLQEKIGIRNAAQTLHISWGFVLCYVKPLHEALNPTLEGYSKGLRDGDNGGAMLDLLLRFVYLPYVMGKNLGLVIEKFPQIAAQLEESSRAKEVLALRAFWQMILNLQLPPSAGSKKLEGEIYSQSSETSEIPWKVANENLAHGELLLFFDDHDARTAKLNNEEKGKTYSELIQGYFPGRIETFHRGIALFATARRTRRRKHRAEATKVKKQVAKWAKAGDPNIQHYELLLNAEDAVLDKKFASADALYKKAISNAARIGHIHHAALFHERYAQYRLEIRGDRDDCKYHMDQAIRYYTEWGAVGKAEQLLKQKDSTLIVKEGINR